MDEFWLTGGRLITPHGIIDGAVRIARGRLVAIRPRAPRGAVAISVRGAYVAPGFMDLHVWGPPSIVSREAVKGGTTAFLSAIGPDAPERLWGAIADRALGTRAAGADCLGLHLEGPFLNPARAGALPRRWMRRPTTRVLQQLAQAARGHVRLMTLAPELPGALDAIRWCRRRGIVASLGHSEADAAVASRAVEVGARGVTHVFNGMPPLHHRRPGLLDVALADDRVTTMVIADGTHVGPAALRLLLRVKGPGRVALVTDSIRHQGWDVVSRQGAFYTRRGVLAGSQLTMMRAVRNAVELAGASLEEAVRMASEVPARLLGLGRSTGTLAIGKRADLVVFNRAHAVMMTIVNGRVVYQRGR